MATFVVAPSRNRIVQAAFAGLAAANKAATKKPARPDIPKEAVVRSEPYRRLVASMPCRHCHKPGPSQAAHIPTSGKGIKTDDRQTFALCADGPRYKGCHPQFDQYQLGDHAWTVAQGEEWARETRLEITVAGEWPKKLALYPEERARPKVTKPPKKPLAKAAKRQNPVKKVA